MNPQTICYYIHKDNLTLHNAYPVSDDNMIKDESTKAFLMDRINRYVEGIEADANGQRVLLLKLNRKQIEDSMKDQTKKDLETATERNGDTICIQLLAQTMSPYGDDYIHNSDPCFQKHLIDLGWKEYTGY